MIIKVSLSSASDRWSWMLHGLGVFSVKSDREEIDKHVLVAASSHARWSKVLPIKLNIFWWRMFLDRLPTRSNLSNKGIDIPCVLCPNCEASIESRDPSLWDLCFKCLKLSSNQRRIIEASFVSMWWHIWKFRNASLFSLKKPRKAMIFDDIVSHTFFWVNSRCSNFKVGIGASGPNGDALRKCILEGPYTPTTVVIPAVHATENSPAIPEQTTVKTVLNMSLANKARFESEKEAIHLILTGTGDEIYSTNGQEKEAIHLILTGTGDEIYSTVDACKTAHEMWESIERLQQGESLNIQDVKIHIIKYQSLTNHLHQHQKASIPTRTPATTRHKGKEIDKPITPPSESAFDKDNDPEQA
ncbi:RNA-directed DNA polymerase, eukaryota [Tanacetum coccineum]